VALGHEGEFHATNEAALGAIQGKRCVKGTKTLPIEPLTVKEVRQALEARQARWHTKLKPWAQTLPVEYPYEGPVGSEDWGPNSPSEAID